MNILKYIAEGDGKDYVSSFEEWSQEEDGLMGVTPQTKEGACCAYCLYWLKSLEEGETKLPDFKTKLAAINTQLSFYKTDWKQIFTNKGVDVSGQEVKVNWLKSGSLEFQTKMASKTIKEIIGNIETSLVIELYLDNSTSHLIALTTKNENISVFDPNYGVIVINREFIAQFFDLYLKNFNQEFQNKLVKMKTYQTNADFNLRPLFS